MRLVQMHPVAGFDSMVRRMNHLFNDLDVGGRRLDRSATAAAGSWAPRVDITEDATAFTLHMDLPGIAKENVNVAVDENRVLSVRGEVKKEEVQEGTTIHRRERRTGLFERSFTLPEHIDADSISARFEHGVLYLSLPKKAEQKPGVKTIAVG